MAVEGEVIVTGAAEEAAYAVIGLDRLVDQAATIVGGGDVALVVRVAAGADDAVIAAARGAHSDSIGERVTGVSEAALSRGGFSVLPAAGSTSIPILSSRGFEGLLEVRPPHRAGVGGSSGPLERIAGLAGAVLSHGAIPDGLARSLRQEATALGEAMDARTGVSVPLSFEAELAAKLVSVVGGDVPTAIEARLAAQLCSIGYMGLPDEILTKPNRLEPHEAAFVTQHPQWAAAALSQVPGFEPVSTVVLYVEERWDGAGGPAGLAASQIPLASRAVSVARRYRALVSQRSYRPVLSRDDALSILAGEAGSTYDPQIVGELAALV